MGSPASPPAQAVLGVRYAGSQRTFAAGHDVVIGRDLRADIRITNPLISRVHLLLRFDGGRWLAIDNGSMNGIFVGHRRVQSVEVCDGQTINVGGPNGPCLSFEIGRRAGPAGRPPRTIPNRFRQPRGSAHPTDPQPAAEPNGLPAQTARPMRPPGDLRRRVPAPGAPPGPQQPAALTRPSPPPAEPSAGSALPTELAPPVDTPAGGSRLPDSVGHDRRSGTAESARPPGPVSIGRSDDNDIVVADVLASRRHATLLQTPLGIEIRDCRSINGTFVNGIRIGSAILTEGDLVTIGNSDLEFRGGTLVRQTDAAALTGGLEVDGVHFRIDDKELLDNVSLTARPGTVTAIIGGSGAGKTTLARLIAGYTRPSSGSVTFEGHDIHAEYATLRTRIGMVPQDDVVHHQLTVNQALGYAAELRLPPDTSREDRNRVVAEVLEELELTKQGDTRVDKLSGGQRKRASVALELLTGPSLLVLDEPTTGLDPALDSQVMMMLRKLADAGRTVLVVTHSVSYLDLCDQLLLMAPGGKTAYFGPPDQIGSVMGTTQWAQIFTKVGADPDEAKRRFLAQKQPEPALPKDRAPKDLGEPVRTDVRRQFWTLARRQVRLVVSDRWYTVFLSVLPFILGLLALTVPGESGLGLADPDSKTPAEPSQILVLLIIGAVFMGTALTIRDLVGERNIFHREQAVGLSTRAYLLAKIAVFAVFATAQAGIATTIAIIGKGTPTHGAVLLGNSTVELFVTVAATCTASALTGMALSALARSSDQILPLMVVAIMAQLVFSGGLIPVTDRAVLDQLTWLTPARWGFSAAASTVDLNAVQPSPFSPKDSHWEHTAGAWLLDMAMLVVLSGAYAGLVRWRLRLKR